MSVVDKFNSLNGKQITRKRIESIINLAKKENNTTVIYRLSKVLLDNPKDNVFKLEITEFASTGLNAPRHSGSYKEALDNCGRLKPGYKFENGSVIKVVVKKKANKKKGADLRTKKEAPKKVLEFNLNNLPRKYHKAIYASAISELKRYADQSAEPLRTAAENMIILLDSGKFEYLYFKEGYGREANKPEYKNVPVVSRKWLASEIKNLEVDKLNFLLEKYKEYLYETAWHSYSFKGKSSTEIFKIVTSNIKLIERVLKANTAAKPKVTVTKKKASTKKAPASTNAKTPVKPLVKAVVKNTQDKPRVTRKRKPSANKQLDLFGLNGRKKQTGLKAAAIENIEVVAEEVNPVIETVPAVPQPRPGSIAHRLQQKQNVVREYYRVDNKEISDFLGRIEKKTKESVVITMTGGQGSGKTRFLFQVMNAFAQNYRCGHASMEEHPESSLYEDKALQYLNATALNNVDNPEVKSLPDLEKLIEENEIIFIDSFQKLQELIPRYEVDKDLRKKYDGKLFVIVFQQTSNGSMRGGTKSQFDGDIILMTEKFEDYRENYIYPDKNRYNSIPTPELKFNIYSGTMLRTESTGNTEPEGVTVDLEKLNFDVE